LLPAALLELANLAESLDERGCCSLLLDPATVLSSKAEDEEAGRCLSPAKVV
jgi:hypothetical protein